MIIRREERREGRKKRRGTRIESEAPSSLKHLALTLALLREAQRTHDGSIEAAEAVIVKPSSLRPGPASNILTRALQGVGYT
ncbi:hypothetical protein E2C01_094566 [Portunus trituberculatus]|uniref:Uncharacterized protein n=1 Tax=Portunus trituberculatus TaxID=210409 RepID=A0A5B7JWF3_PORTR|nr:hypothetical protein [Portunus trituberculatus]